MKHERARIARRVAVAAAAVVVVVEAAAADATEVRGAIN